jgi:hypothetical protein
MIGLLIVRMDGKWLDRKERSVGQCSNGSLYYLVGLVVAGFLE